MKYTKRAAPGFTELPEVVVIGNFAQRITPSVEELIVLYPVAQLPEQLFGRI